MSPLIEEARRRQRRRRIALAALLLVAVAVAAVVGLTQRGSGTAQRPAPQKAKPAILILKSVPRSSVLHLGTPNNPSGEAMTVLRTLVTRVGGQARSVTYSVRVDPKTGKVELVTTTPRP